MMGDEVQKDSTNLRQISANTLRRCANGLKWIVSLNKLEYKVMGVKDFISTNRDIVTKILLAPQFKQLCPEFAQFASENKCIYQK